MVGDFLGRLLGRRPRGERGNSSAPVPAATPSDEQMEPEQPEARGPLGQAGMRAQRLALDVISRRAVRSRPQQSHHSAGILSLSLGMAPRWAAGFGAVGASLRRVAEGFLGRSPLGLAHWRTYQAPYVPEEFSPVWREPRREDNVPEVTPGQPGEGMPLTTLRPPTATRRSAAPLGRPGQSAPTAQRRVSRATPPMGARSKAPIARVPASSIRRRQPGVALHRPTIHVDRPMASGIHSPIVSGSIEPVASPERWSAREYEHARSKPDKQPASMVEFLFGPEGGQSTDSGQSLRARESSGPWEPPPAVPARPSAPRPAPSAGVAGPDTAGRGPRAYRQSGPPQSQEGREQRQSSRASIVQRSRRLVARGVALVFRRPAAPSAGPGVTDGAPQPAGQAGLVAGTPRPSSTGRQLSPVERVSQREAVPRVESRSPSHADVARPAPRPDVSAGGKAASEIGHAPGPGRAVSPGELSALRADAPRTESREAFHVQATGRPASEDSVSVPDVVHPAQAGESRRPRGLMARAVEMVLARHQAPAPGTQVRASMQDVRSSAGHAGQEDERLAGVRSAEEHASVWPRHAQHASGGGEGSAPGGAHAPATGRQSQAARRVEERPSAAERPPVARGPISDIRRHGTGAGGPPAGLVRRSLQAASRATEMVLRKERRPATPPAVPSQQPEPRHQGVTRPAAGHLSRSGGTTRSPHGGHPPGASEGPVVDMGYTAPDQSHSAPGQAPPLQSRQAGEALGGQAARQQPGATRGHTEEVPSQDVQDASRADWRGLRATHPGPALARPSGVLRRSLGLAIHATALVFRKGASASPGAALPSPASDRQPAQAGPSATTARSLAAGASQGHQRRGVARAPRALQVTRVAQTVARRSVGMALQAGEMVFRKRTGGQGSGASPSMSRQTSQVEGETSAAVQPGPRSGRAANVAAESSHVQRARQAPAMSVKLQASASSATLGPRPAASRIARMRQAVRRSATTVLHARELVFRKWTPSGVQSGRMDAHAVGDSAARRASVGAWQDASAQGSPVPLPAPAGFRAQHEGHAAEEARPSSRQRKLSAPLMRSLAPVERRRPFADWPRMPTPARSERQASPVRSGPVWLQLQGAGERAPSGTPDVAEASDRLPLATAPYRTPADARGQARPPAMALPAVHDARHGASSKSSVRRKLDAHAAPAANGNGHLHGATPLPGPEHIQLAWQSARPSSTRREEEQPRIGEQRDGVEPAPELKPEQVELLASRIYSYIKQKLAMERERHGRPGFPLWP